MTATLFRHLDEQGDRFSMITTGISSHEHCLLEEKGVMWLPIQIITYSLNKVIFYYKKIYRNIVAERTRGDVKVSQSNFSLPSSK